MKRLFEHIGKAETRGVLAIMTTIGCFILVGLLMVVEVPKANERILDFSMGVVFGGCLLSVYQFFFGSSKNDADKIKQTKQTTTE